MARRRSWLRLLAELHAVGIAGSSRAVLRAVQTIAADTAAREREAMQAALSILAAFAKAGREEFVGMPLHHPELPSQADDEVRCLTLMPFNGRKTCMHIHTYSRIWLCRQVRSLQFSKQGQSASSSRKTTRKRVLQPSRFLQTSRRSSDRCDELHRSGVGALQ